MTLYLRNLLRDLDALLREDYLFLKLGILFPKLFWTSVRKKCSSDREKLLKFEAEGRKFLILQEQFIQTVKVQNIFWNRILFKLITGDNDMSSRFFKSSLKYFLFSQ